jgi:hypothetical protein
MLDLLAIVILLAFVGWAFGLLPLSAWGAEGPECPPFCKRDVCGVGFELAFVVPLLRAAWLRRRS